MSNVHVCPKGINNTCDVTGLVMQNIDYNYARHVSLVLITLMKLFLGIVNLMHQSTLCITY